MIANIKQQSALKAGKLPGVKVFPRQRGMHDHSVDPQYVLLKAKQLGFVKG